ncbi:MAG: CBM20 domain-containing protein [Bacteroidales bacterium]|nr:hypothetical protein [Bacteroidales bacterium]MDD7528820.1 CBM20 domain-containing protein [Bacteroidales bacterium]MDY4851190.1 CBM20 domain-containing protein [Paludibacteraceae bacterium]MDY6037226.1 CBM20 domain-containing protein [Paludibacteraceae bacterium]
MKTVKFFTFALLAGAVMLGCDKDPQNGGNNNGNEPEEPVIVKEDAPAIAAPGAGKVTIAVRVPEGTCNGIVAVGSNGTEELAWTPAGTDFVRVADTESWYQVTLTYAADMIVKVIAKSDDGAVTWGTQWGMNTDEKENVTWVVDEGLATIDNSENGGEVKLISFQTAEGKVLFLDVDAWKSAPCVERNQAGQATFTLTAPALPEGYEVYIVGNFAEEDWNWGSETATPTHKMELVDGKYTHAAEVPAKFEYKYFYKTAEGVMDWNNAEEIGANRQMALDLKAVDEVKAWKGLPAAE